MEFFSCFIYYFYSCIQIVEKLEKLEQEYHENIQEWENLIETNKE